MPGHFRWCGRSGFLLFRPMPSVWSGIVPVMAKTRTRGGAKTRKIGTLAEAAAASLLPVDPELFLWCQGVYYAAATMTMPVQNPEYTRIPLNEKGGFVLKDMPINRGMQAAKRSRFLPDGAYGPLEITLQQFNLWLLNAYRRAMAG